jgi:hypothetical protein
MSEEQRDALVVLESDRAARALAELRSVAQVTQVLAPRLALIRSDREVLARAARIDGVAAVHDQVLGELPADLTDSERTFVAAWQARRAPKTRRGEGLSWDAPGFEPPDPPRRGR